MRLSDKAKCAYLIRLTFKAYCLEPESGALMHLYGDVLSEKDIVDDILKGLLRLQVNALNEHIEVLQLLVDVPEGFMTSPVTIVDITRNVYTFRTGVIGGKFWEFNITPDYAGRIRFNEDVVLLDYPW